jgi:hypothetical protein
MPTNPWVAPGNNTSSQLGVAGTAIVAASTATLSPSSATAPDFILPGGTLYVGMGIRITANGIMSLAGTANNLTFNILYGATVTGTTGALAQIVSVSPSWELDALITCRSIGTSGTVWTQGKICGIVAAAPQSVSRIDSNVFGTQAVTTIDTTTSSKIALQVILSASTSVSITCEQFLVELIG